VAERDITCHIVTDVDGTSKAQVIPAGTPLDLTLMTTAGSVMREDIALLFQQNMVDIGIRVSFEFVAANVFFLDAPDGQVFGRRFDLAEFAWSAGYCPDADRYRCSDIPSEKNGWSGLNESGWCDPEFDRLSRLAAKTLNRDDALSLYAEAQQLFVEQVPVIPLFPRVKVMAIKPDIVGFAPDSTVSSETWNIEEWHFR
jgi:peptide/nickel transport system substrate-binding protein